MRRNHLLATLSAEAFDRIRPNLRLRLLSRGAVLCRPGERQHHAYFPIDSIVGLLHTLTNGASTEISLVGNEGFIGLGSVLGGTSTCKAVVLSAGFAYELPTQLLRDEFDRNGDMLHLLLRYTQSVMTQVAQAAVCNRHHSVEQQLCSWLLFALDRLTGNRLIVTHELIADVLGVRRESVTSAAIKLQQHGVLEYRRGRVTVLDRAKLERLACECHATVKKETDRLQSRPGRLRPARSGSGGLPYMRPSVVRGHAAAEPRLQAPDKGDAERFAPHDPEAPRSLATT